LQHNEKKLFLLLRAGQFGLYRFNLEVQHPCQDHVEPVKLLSPYCILCPSLLQRYF